MGNLMTLAEIPPIQVWDSVRARRVQGDQLTLAIVELDPDAEVPEHTHPSEQNGMVIRGEMRFRVGDEGAQVPVLLWGAPGTGIGPSLRAVVAETTHDERGAARHPDAEPGRRRPLGPRAATVRIDRGLFCSFGAAALENSPAHSRSGRSGCRRATARSRCSR